MFLTFLFILSTYSHARDGEGAPGRDQSYRCNFGRLEACKQQNLEEIKEVNRNIESLSHVKYELSTHLNTDQKSLNEYREMLDFLTKQITAQTREVNFLSNRYIFSKNQVTSTNFVELFSENLTLTDIKTAWLGQNHHIWKIRDHENLIQIFRSEVALASTKKLSARQKITNLEEQIANTLKQINQVNFQISPLEGRKSSCRYNIDTQCKIDNCSGN